MWFFESCLNRLLFEVYIVVNICIVQYYLVFSNILTNINYSIKLLREYQRNKYIFKTEYLYEIKKKST